MTVTRCSVGKHAVKLYRAEDVSPDYIDNKPLYALINLHYDEPVERLANIILDRFLAQYRWRSPTVLGAVLL
jgi:hypothetical protein